MVVILILIGLLVALFAGSFLSKRRFGMLGMGLAAGAIISPIWGDTAGYVISASGLVQEGPLVNAIAVSVLILVPAVLFMFHGYTYKHIFGRIIGSLSFMLLAAAFLVEPVGAAFVLSGPAADAYSWFVMYHELIISAGVSFAVADLLLARPVHKEEKGRHKH